MAPELLFPSMFGKVKCQVSKEADVYAFGMVILQVSFRPERIRFYAQGYCCVQVLTCQVPFHTLRDTEISYKVIRGDRPVLPTNAEGLGITNELRGLLNRCWLAECTERPRVDEILHDLSESPARGITFPPSRISRVPNDESFFEPEKQKPGNECGLC